VNFGATKSPQVGAKIFNRIDRILTTGFYLVNPVYPVCQRLYQILGIRR
jgi:hypothetical protein